MICGSILTKWHGFEPIQYLLDAPKVLGLPLARVNINANPTDAVQTTLGEVLRETANGPIKNVYGSP